MINTLSIGEIIFDIIEGREILGGAPLNVATHLARLGANSYIFSSLGTDQLGKLAIERIKEEKIDSTFISLVPKETGKAIVTLKDGKADYEFNFPASWDDLDLNQEDVEKLNSLNLDAIVFGTLSQRSEKSRKVINTVLDNVKAKERFLDVNLRKKFYSEEIIKESIKRATILKLSDEELVIICFLLAIKVDAKAILEKFPNLKYVLITQGDKGASLYSNKEIFKVKVKEVKIKDTVGAGDSFSAAFLYYYLKTGDVEKALENGVILSSFVVSTEGATAPYLKEELKLNE